MICSFCLQSDRELSFSQSLRPQFAIASKIQSFIRWMSRFNGDTTTTSTTTIPI